MPKKKRINYDGDKNEIKKDWSVFEAIGIVLNFTLTS